MQPYFMPYMGYWQLMNYVDKFVVYDDIQFTKKGWIHRNRYLNNGSDQMLTLPLKKDSDYLDVAERYLSQTWPKEKDKLFRKVEAAYRKAPYFDEGISVFRECLNYPGDNLFEFIFHSIKVIGSYLGIESELLISSEAASTNHLKGERRVIAICNALDASEYVNPIGGKELYAHETFNENDLSLKFHRIDEIVYQQFNSEFISNLSILDVLMFNGIAGTRNLLSRFSLDD
ncbi:hypothetical protein AKL09_09325 [Idiomarina loihiensis]|nr:hypothetical protein [Idiomarina loihiensis]